MAVRPGRWLDRKSRERAMRQWAEMAESVEFMAHGRIRGLADEAHALRASLNRFLMRGDRKASISRVALDALDLPGGTDWRWRPGFMAGHITPRGVAVPEPGTRLGDRAAVWHDCNERAMILEQVQNPRATDLSPFGMRLEVFGFTGSFLSISIDLPTEALEGLTRNHILRLETTLVLERPLNVYARLNIGHGPNTDEVLQHLHGLEAGLQSQRVIEFDLAYTEMNEKRLEKIWLDLIFESPGMSAVEIRELFLSRHLRADF
ncbi:MULTISPECIES: DUF6478 family protein [Paracoccus]|jgi:hypothetical protein|uniref:Uncharacterized protein n=1 Tax=Paracoccus litorisediminis TaxID=2006130 RepID=A0A844HVM0_9RHOB|nr:MULTISPECIES: DUF6478 family protein [Paracoccus]MBD9526226.1 hypothetical protein [Paracoccus sp. PAR01]MTH62365.1 hypothetical protein [Paracoccus litorisediminis]